MGKVLFYSINPLSFVRAIDCAEIQILKIQHNYLFIDHPLQIPFEQSAFVTEDCVRKCTNNSSKNPINILRFASFHCLRLSVRAEWRKTC